MPLPSTRVKKTPEERAESNRVACSKYYHNNKEIIYKRNKDYIIEHQRLNYTEERKQHKKDYYFKNRNYKNLNFSKDIVKMFSNPLEVV
tara:strand:- start:211 stop:477 length:267 start_codon:yes stop_codon:yes gene_type:complete